MRQICIFLSVVICVLGTANGYCQNLVTTYTTNKITKEKLWGFCDRFYSAEIIKSQYDSTMAFTEGLGRIKSGEKYGFVDSKNKQVIPPKYELADAFSEGLAMVMLNGKTIYIDKNGTDVFKKTFKMGTAFHEGFAMVWNDENKAGFINAKGNLEVPFKYNKAFPFNGGLATVISETDNKWTAINTKGETVFVFDEKVKNVLGGFNDGLVSVFVASVGNDNNYDFVNEKGQFICIAPYRFTTPFSNRKAIIAYQNKNRELGNYQVFKYGIINREGSEIVKAQYACLQESLIPNIYFYGKTSESFSSCNGYGLLDSTGKELTQPLYKNFTRLNDTTFLCKTVARNEYLLLTTKGKELLSSKYNDVAYNIIGSDTLLFLILSSELSIYNTQKGLLKENSSYLIKLFEKQKLLLFEDSRYTSGSLIHMDGKLILDNIQTHIFERDSTLKNDIPFILVRNQQDKDFKMFNINTLKFMPFEYQFKDYVSSYYTDNFNEGLLKVGVKTKYGYIDTSGKLKIPAIYEKARDFHNGLAVVGKKGKTEYSDYMVYINKLGIELKGIKAASPYASDFSEGYALYQKADSPNKGINDKFIYYINTQGKVIFKSESEEYFQHGGFSNGLAAVSNAAGKYGYINTKGVLVIPYQFDMPKEKIYAFEIKFDKYGYAKVEKDGKAVTIDKTGKVVK